MKIALALPKDMTVIQHVFIVIVIIIGIGNIGNISNINAVWLQDLLSELIIDHKSSHSMPKCFPKIRRKK